MKPKVAIVIAASVLSFVLIGVGAILSLKLRPPDIDFGPDVETPAPLRAAQSASVASNGTVSPTDTPVAAIMTVPAPAATALPTASVAGSKSYTQVAMAPSYGVSPTAVAIDTNAVATLSDTASQPVAASSIVTDSGTTTQVAAVMAPAAKRKRTRLPILKAIVRTTRRRLTRRPARVVRQPLGGDGSTSLPGGNNVPSIPGNSVPAAPGTNGPAAPSFRDSVVSDQGGGTNSAGAVSGSSN